jgi:hypothetical protein
MQAIVEGVGLELLSRGVESEGHTHDGEDWPSLILQIKVNKSGSLRIVGKDGAIRFSQTKPMYLNFFDGHAETWYDWQGRTIKRRWDFDDPKFPENLVRYCQITTTDEDLVAALSNEALRKRRR